MFANSRKGRGYPTGRYGRISFCSLSLAFLLFQYIQQESKGNDYLLSGETHPKAHARSSKSQESQLSQPYNDGGLCIQAIQRLQESNIGLLALDFDLTVVDIHTGGQWTQGEHALVRHVRPHMQCLLRNGLLQGLHVAIASFSAQEALIRETLRLALQPVNITKMIVVGGDNYSEETGKCRHLRTIRAVLAESSDSVTSSTTILIDDDKRNIRLADADGYQSLWFDPDHPERLFQMIMSLQDGEQKKRIYPYSA